MPKVYIAVYRPEEGDFLHWALYVESDPPEIFQVTGSHPDSERDVSEADPEDPRHIENIGVGEISSNDMAEFRGILARVAVDDETVHWNCQDYVLEALDALIEECVFDEDEEYAEGRQEAVEKYFGPQ